MAMMLDRVWGKYLRRLAIGAVAKVWPGSSAAPADVAAGSGDLWMATAGEMEHRVRMEEERSTPPSATTTGTSSGQDPQIRRASWRWGRTMLKCLLEKVLGLHGRMRRAFRAAIDVVGLHFITGTCSMLQLSAVQSEDHGEHLKRLMEYTKKAIPLESLLMGALCNHPFYHSSNTAFKICLVLVLLAFFTDFLSALLLHLDLLKFLIKHLIYTSSITQMVMPFFLFLSSGQLQSYMILVVPLPFLSVTLFHGTSLGAGENTSDSALDHSFDISAWIYAISAGGALISPTNTMKFVASSFLACLLFLTIFVARYLMLIATLRPAEVIGHVESLMNVLKLFCELTVIMFILDRFGWRAALVATSVIIMDAVLLSVPSLLLVNSPRTTDGTDDEPGDLWKNQQLLLAALVSVLFMALTRTYSEHVTACDNAPLGPAATRRLLLYFGAFLWSLNRMLITPGDVPVPLEGGQKDTVVTVWSALERVRACVVLAAALDISYKICVTFIMGSS